MDNNAVYIVAAEQNNHFTQLNMFRENAAQLQLKVLELIIDPLNAGWDTPLEENHFRSGNGPLLAIEQACKLLVENKADIIFISGEDNLRSDYSKHQRHQLMQIYPDLSLPEAYTQLAKAWCEKYQLSDERFKELAAKLFDNYFRQFNKLHSADLPDQKWFDDVTTLFRGVDCANPAVDYSGKIMLATSKCLEKLKIDRRTAVEIKGIACTQTTQSGPQAIADIVDYQHLETAYQSACQQAGIDFTENFNHHQAFLEAYTCFPVVPLAFLMTCRIVSNIDVIAGYLENYSVTVTGGMNLAKGPWNCPVLRAIIDMFHLLLSSDEKKIAGIHGNGGLGEKQGFMILGVEK